MTYDNVPKHAENTEEREDFLDRMAKGWVILIFLLLFFFTTSFFMPWFSQVLGIPDKGVTSIDLQFTYSPQRLYQMIGQYGERGRQVYAVSHLTADVIFPLVYAFFFSLSITYTFRRSFSLSSRVQKLKYLPFVLLGFDLLENFFLVILLLAFPQPLAALAFIAGLVTAVKWLLSGIVVFFSLFGLIVFLGSRRKKTETKSL